MYSEFFGLRENPFETTADPRFLFLGKSHKEALSHLTYAVQARKSFAVITGELGTGKTTLLQALVSKLNGNTRIAFLLNPKSGPDNEFLHSICEGLGINGEKGTKGTKGEYLARLNDFLTKCYAQKLNVVLIIDEAQTLKPQLLEEVRLLTNLETSSSKLLQVILAGQPELDNMLALPQFRPLKQRISVRCRLKPLGRIEIKQYIKRRLRIAGAKRTYLFSPQAIKKIYRYSQGVPRLINLVCNNALIRGCTNENRVIGEDLIEKAISGLEGIPLHKNGRLICLSAIAVLMALLAGAVFFWGTGEIIAGLQEFWGRAWPQG